MSEYFLVYVTTGNQKEAEDIATHLVQDRLVACANIFPQIESIYCWKGSLQKSQEVVLILKTHQKVIDKVMVAIKKLHSYEVPCIVVLPIFKGEPSFLNWIDSCL